MSRVQPLPNYRSNIEGLNEQVQEIQDIVQNEKLRIQVMEIDSLKCEKMLQDNYKRYDPRAHISPEDRRQMSLRRDQNERDQNERRREEHLEWLKILHNSRMEFIQPLFKSSKYMDQDATNPYVVLTAGGPAEAASATLREMPEFETKIQTLTQQVSDLKQQVSGWSQKTENLYHKYLNMNNMLQYQEQNYALKQPPPSNPQPPRSNAQAPSSNQQAPPSDTFQSLSAADLRDMSTPFLQDYYRQKEIAIANNWTILPPM